MLHHVNDASFALPEQLKDRTTHTFASFDDQTGEFSVLMSHADVQPDNTLAEVADDLLTELSKSLPDFSLVGSIERTVGGAPAIELAYNWRSRFKPMHQRQVVMLVPALEPQEPQEQQEQQEQQALLIAATCPREFADKWHATFEDILGSVKLRDRTEAPAMEAVVAATINASTIFALCAGRRSLHAFANQDDACANTDAYEVQAGAWYFFDAAGNPFEARFVLPRAWWRGPGKYVLERETGQGWPSLRDQLHRAEAFVSHSPSAGVSSIAEIRAALDHFMKG